MPVPVPPTVVFCDLDGCLVDSTRAITGSLNHALEALGLPPRPVADLLRFIGPPLADNAATLIAEAGGEQHLAPRLVHAYRARYSEVAAVETSLVPGIPEALDRLGEVSVLAVVTSKPAPFARDVLEATGLADHFAAVHAPDLDERAEPKAVTLRRALADLVDGRPAASTVMVGDRHHDVAAGRACGTGVVGVTWGVGDRAELEGAGADEIVDAPAELVALLTAGRAPSRDGRRRAR